MNGQEATIIRLKDLNKEFRTDAEYHQKKYLSEDIQRKKYTNLPLGEIAFITDGQHGYHEVDESSNISLLTAKNAKNWFADKVDADRVAQWVDDDNKRSSLQVGDLILSTRGSVGYCALVTESVLPANIDQDVARIAIGKGNASPQYILAYLNGRFGQDWIQRNATGMVQQGLSLAKLRELPVSILSTYFQSQIESIVEQAHEKLEESKSLYAAAENLLLDELGLPSFVPSTEQTIIKSFRESFLQTGRLDAEFYQPKYEDLTTRLTAIGGLPLGMFCPDVHRGVQPQFVDGGSVFVIASKAVRPNGVLLDPSECTDEAFYNSKTVTRAQLQNGDVLLNGTGRGTLGRASIYDYDSAAIADNHVTILRPDINVCDPYYLMIFLNSIAGQMQSEKFQCGTSGQLELYPNQIEQFIVCAPQSKSSPEEGVQAKVRTMVQNSFALQRDSKRLLETAKRAVELAIEEDEQAALEFIRSD